MEKTVYFVRHGQTDSNVDKIFRGRDAALTETGRAQARLVAERVAALSVDALISSDFPRAHDTAAIIGHRIGLPVASAPVFGEWREPIHVYGKHRDEPDIASSLSRIHEMLTHHDYRQTDEETFAELAARAEEALQFLITHPAERLCVVTHGGFLSVLFGAMVFGSEFTKRDFVHIFKHLSRFNTGITHAVYKDESPHWSVITWNDLSHFAEPKTGGE